MAATTSTMRAYQLIRERVLDGRFAQGTRVREAEVSDLLGIGRTPVREALKLLSAEGYLESEPNKGVSVAVWSHARVFEAYTVRATLEALAASIAATRTTPNILTAMHRACDKMDALLAGPDMPPTTAVSDLNGHFHNLVAEAAGSSVLAESIHRLAQVPAHRTFETYCSDDLRRSFQQHRNLTLAVEDRDVMAAETIMRAHILDGRAHWSSHERSTSFSQRA